MPTMREEVALKKERRFDPTPITANRAVIGKGQGDGACGG